MFLTKEYRLSLVHSIAEDFVGADCSRLHGHDFKLQVTISGEADEISGRVIDRDQLDQIVEAQILRRFDKTRASGPVAKGTGEVMCQEFLNLLRATEIGEKVVSVQVVETRKNRFQGVLTNSCDNT